MYTSQKGKLVKEFSGMKTVNATSLDGLDEALGFVPEEDSDDDDDWDPDA